MGIDGKKDVLGLYVGESEGANFWLGVLTKLQNRGATFKFTQKQLI
jgi:transposase-like protein